MKTTLVPSIIPLREKIGNYDLVSMMLSCAVIIPLREKIGNYDLRGLLVVRDEIIPLREKIGNYDELQAENK